MSATGPDGRPNTAMRFKGKRNSFIEFPNSNGKLDTKDSITLLAWIYPEGTAGPIANYHPNGWGVHFWLDTPRTLFVRFTRRGNRGYTKSLRSRGIRVNQWQYVGASYDRRTGIARLWINRRTVAKKYIGRVRLATNFPVRMGVRIGDRRLFKGRISCFQVFNYALNRRQIYSRERACFGRG